MSSRWSDVDEDECESGSRASILSPTLKDELHKRLIEEKKELKRRRKCSAGSSDEFVDVDSAKKSKHHHHHHKQSSLTKSDAMDTKSSHKHQRDKSDKHRRRRSRSRSPSRSDATARSERQHKRRDDHLTSSSKSASGKKRSGSRSRSRSPPAFDKDSDWRRRNYDRDSNERRPSHGDRGRDRDRDRNRSSDFGGRRRSDDDRRWFRNEHDDRWNDKRRDRRNFGDSRGRGGGRGREGAGPAESDKPVYITKKVEENMAEIQRRKALWQKGRAVAAAATVSEQASSSESVGFAAVAARKSVPDSSTNWSNMLAATSADGKSIEKFKKLMGITKAGDVDSQATSMVPSTSSSGGGGAVVDTDAVDVDPEVARQRRKQQQIAANLDQQYEMARMVGTTYKGMGLGFSSQAATNLYGAPSAANFLVNSIQSEKKS